MLLCENNFQIAHNELIQVREEAESNPSKNNNLKPQHAKAVCFRTKIESKRKAGETKLLYLAMKETAPNYENIEDN